MTLNHIRLELAREAGLPEGDRHSGYDLVVPLDGDDRLDPAAHDAGASAWRVRRFADEDTLAVGRLHHGPGGRWLIDFGAEAEARDAGHRLVEDRFVLGEYVSVESADGTEHTYRVAQVQAL